MLILVGVVIQKQESLWKYTQEWISELLYM